MISKSDKDFIIDTLECAIEWREYADDYFKKKHHLEKDKENVKKCIEILIREGNKCKVCNGSGFVHRTATDIDLPCITCRPTARREYEEKEAKNGN